jgi:hypothetical protein
MAQTIEASTEALIDEVCNRQPGMRIVIDDKDEGGLWNVSTEVLIAELRARVPQARIVFDQNEQDEAA